jgi:hypothetical protein
MSDRLCKLKISFESLFLNGFGLIVGMENVNGNAKDRCFDFKNIFRRILGEKNGVCSST